MCRTYPLLYIAVWLSIQLSNVAAPIAMLRKEEDNFGNKPIH